MNLLEFLGLGCLKTYKGWLGLKLTKVHNFSVDFRLKIFLFTITDYRVLYFIRIVDMPIICLVVVFIVSLASFVRKKTEFTRHFKGKFWNKVHLKTLWFYCIVFSINTQKYFLNKISAVLKFRQFQPKYSHKKIHLEEIAYFKKQ